MISNDLRLFLSMIRVTSVGNNRIQYEASQFSKAGNTFEKKLCSHNLPDSSRFDLGAIQEGQSYFLSSIKIDGKWYLASAVNIETGATVTDSVLLKYAKNQLSQLTS